MRNQAGPRSRGSRVRRRGAALLALSTCALAACSRGPALGEQEEISKSEQDVPAVVRTAAQAIGQRLGGARCDAWFWDSEDDCWEVTLTGLPRQAELDLRPDGAFDELELVYGLDEVDAVLPEVGQTIRMKCGADTGLLIELSLRREAFLDDVPTLAEAWVLSGVVLEFQGPGGNDFEKDARGLLKVHRGDDADAPPPTAPKQP